MEKEVRIVVTSLTEEPVDADELIEEVKKIAKEKGVAEEDLSFEKEKPFPTEGAILILLGLFSKIAYDIWKDFVLPELKEKYENRYKITVKRAGK